ncbi:hypothetical protein QBC44DRAFT_351810 [Cladorrhinum sp. PSN332]|nr:hypothetical protein QBC44DRAFT_351810 [Cladorrhinum sp. PSN332]
MLDTFEILTTSGVVLWSRTYAPVSPSVVNNFITDVFIEEKSSVAGAKNGASASENPPYKYDQHTLRWTFEKELGIIFVAVYRSLLHISWIDKLVDNIKAIFVSLYKRELTKPNTTIVQCLTFNEYFDQQLKELEQAGAKAHTRAVNDDVLSDDLGDEPSLPSTKGQNKKLRNETSPGSSPIASPNVSRPSTPSASHLLVAKGGPMGKMSRRARKAQNANSAPASSGDEASLRKTKAKPAKRGRKWDADGLADEDDEVQLDYSVINLPSDSEAEAGARPGAVEEVDASTWGSKTKGKFVLKDLGDEVQSILADADAKKNAASKSTEPATSLVGSGLSAIGGLFRNVVGGKVLTKQDLEKAMKGMEEHLLKKNVAREAAVRLCEGVEKELVGVKTGSFESTNTRIQKAMEASLTKMLTPTSSLDLLRDIDSITSPSATSLRKARPYVMSIVGVNGVGKSTNLSKICFFLLQNKYKVLIAAGDTFRSGAVEQLAVHVRNLKELTAREGGQVELYQKGYGKDAAAVAKDAVAYAAQEGFDVVLIDTAGRRHNDQRLMSSLEKFAKFAQPDKILMVGEALVGTDSVAQARNFNASFGAGRSLDGFIISKCDTVGDMVGTLVSIVHATNVPVLFVGVGQHYSDLRNFSVKWAVEKLLASEGGPPPSTLAAELVEDISGSGSSRLPNSDENAELKRLSAIIEKVKNDSTFLQTEEERVEHNHLLVYVSGALFLKGLIPNDDDPFADHEKLRARALQVINFLHATIKETPIILTRATDGNTFLLMGCEPLWLWIIPKILNLLGHRRYLPISGAIEGLCHYIVALAEKHGDLWDLGPSLMRYFQASLLAILDKFKSTKSTTSKTAAEICLPPTNFLDDFPKPLSQECSFALRGNENALRLTISLLTIIKKAVTSSSESQISLFYGHNSGWIIDSLQPLSSLVAAWPIPLEIGLAPVVGTALEFAEIYSSVDQVDIPLLDKANASLIFVCNAIIQTSQQLLSEEEQGVELRRVLCLALIHLAKISISHQSISHLIVSGLLNSARTLVSDNLILGIGTDVGRAVHLLTLACSNPNAQAFRAELYSTRFEDAQARKVIGYVAPANGNLQRAEPPNKRRKVRTQHADSSSSNELFRQLSSLLDADFQSSLDLLPPLLIDIYPRLGLDEQCRVIDLISRMPCAGDGTLKLTRHNPKEPSEFHCSFCSGKASALPPDSNDGGLKSLGFDLFSKIIVHPAFQASKRPRVYAMIVLRRLAKHSTSEEFLNVEMSAPGQWCLRSLHSSVRELRVAAGRTLPTFICERIAVNFDKGIIARNRSHVRNILKTLFDKDVIHLQETTIMAWAQMGRIVVDDELNIVIVTLIGYLGHRNTIVSDCAFNEILDLANFRGEKPRDLFAPFWENLGYSVVKDLTTRPQTTNKVAELLQIGTPDLLRLLQRHALPWLVLTKNREVIQKIAEARGEAETWQPCLDSGNLPHILALLLVQDVPDPTKNAMTLLGTISPDFNNSELVEFLQSEPIPTALELFKAAADANETRINRIRNALSIMASLLTKPKEEKIKKSHMIGRWLSPLTLGLTQRLVEVISQTPESAHDIRDQKRHLRAMEEMVKLCGAYIGGARPLMSASLISALAFPELRSRALACWEAMMLHMDDPEIESQIEATFFIINSYYNSSDDETKQVARSLLRALLGKNKPLMVRYANRLPSLAHLDGLRDISQELGALRTRLNTRDTFGIFARRLTHENPGVVEQALVELVEYLRGNQDYLQISAICEHPDPVVSALTRSLLDCSAKYSGWQSEVTRVSAEALGLIGCLDSNRLEVSREQEQFVVVYNFEDAHETTSFVAFLLENVLVKAFLSTTDTRFQGFLSYVMQELLDKSDFKAAYLMRGEGESEYVWRRWINFSENTREVLMPFLSSKFVISPMPHQKTEYPIFRPGKSYASWIRALVLDLLRNHQNQISLLVFEPLCRLIKVKDLTVTEFLLPYVVLHVIVGQENSDEFRKKITSELLAILEYHPPASASYLEREDAKLYYQAVFRIIDYCMRWLHVRKGLPGNSSGRDQRWATWVYGVVHSVDPELISRRALDCGEYARALFWLEPHIEQRDASATPDEEDNHRLRTSLQKIYTEIDEPDSLEGISAHFAAVTLDQEALNHRKAGRWTAAQSWYEIRHAESPDDPEIQVDLLSCLKESGQYDALLNSVEGMRKTPLTINRILPFAVEASWATGRWETLQKYLQLSNAEDASEVFNLGLGQALLCLKDGDLERFREHIQMVRDKVAGSMTYSATSSLRACHDAMLKCHVLSELEMIVNAKDEGENGQQHLLHTLDRRLEVLGAYISDKQYLLGVRRAAMELLRPKFGNEEIASLWLASARLARKSGSMHQSFNAVLHAQQLGDGSALIENARLLYKIGHHRKAIQDLQLAIKESSFADSTSFAAIAPPSSSKSPESQRNLLTARAQLLLAKWLDSTGQTRVEAQRSQYQEAARTFGQWEKGHYYLGRHYKKILESEKALPLQDQSEKYLSGEIAKLVIENYLRSLNYGTKYLSQTLPRILTLFLDLGTQVEKTPDPKIKPSTGLHGLRKTILAEVYRHFQRHIPRMPAYIFYTVLSQIVARIMHPNIEVFKVLEQMILRVVENHPRQAIWSLFPLITVVQNKQNADRIARGGQILRTIRELGKNVDGSSIDLRTMLRMGEKLAEQLLQACNMGEFQSNRTTNASITRDLHFNHKCTPCPLVVPIETCLTATLPTLTDNVKRHKAFSRDAITIDVFLDHVLVLGSLAKPRKLTARGSDGKQYGLLIKPKDDLRTDQRLMEFNGLINRSLKRDAESSRRQLYIRTYAVTPLNEECGIIEWVDGLKTLRDILIGIYKTRNIVPNYGSLQIMMKDAQKDPTVFTHTILNMFPPVLTEWFISQFPNPSAWFAARLKYTRSCAVMSMVGTILGLGDRHGENVLLEEGNGGIFHVDFNCLFDKGLTFAQPECVPFRLTHNMQNAMGIYKYEGPFRQCSELTLRILRQQEETLMSILEAFIYDPTLDLQRRPRRTTEAVRLNPSSVVESIKRKVRGLLPNETIPLGVEGQADFLIKEAIDPKNLTAMYIGWCPFL